jgi:serine/threonine protein kinase
MMHSMPPAVFANALDRLSAQSEQYFGHRAAIIQPVALADREAARVLRARVRTPNGNDRHIFVKVFKPRGQSSEDWRFMRARVTHDFAVTSEIYRALSEVSDLSAVRPLACFPEELILVTEEARGEPFDALLERRATWQPHNRTLDELTHVALRIGGWLKAFQGVRRLDGRITLDAMREYLDFRLRRLVSNRNGAFSERQRQSVLSHFDALSRDVGQADLNEVLVHGDIAPSNILVETPGPKIVVIDFAMASTGGAYLDVARLFTQLEFLKAKPKFRPHVVARLQAALLEGFDPSLRPSHPLFKLFELQHVICHIANLSLNPAPPMARLYNLYQLHRHRRWLRNRAA